MGWNVNFIVDEVQKMAVLVDGRPVLDWDRTEGTVNKIIPPPYNNAPIIHIRGEGTPPGKNAHMQVFYDSKLIQDMKFDDGETHDLNKN